MRFEPVKHLATWTGRYGRIPGKTSAFHVRLVGGEWQPVLVWHRDDYVLDCIMAPDEQDAGWLADVVVQAKQWLGGAPGGSFQINEFGQVIVPSNGRGFDKAYIGHVRGPMMFVDPLAETRFVYGPQSSLACGSPWRLPYIGIPFHLSARNRIYFWHEDADGGSKREPRHQDQELIRKLRSVRRSGAVRFIVTTYGDVVTKTPPPGAWSQEEKWDAVYVGRIDQSRWFDKEVM